MVHIIILIDARSSSRQEINIISIPIKLVNSEFKIPEGRNIAKLHNLNENRSTSKYFGFCFQPEKKLVKFPTNKFEEVD